MIPLATITKGEADGLSEIIRRAWFGGGYEIAETADGNGFVIIERVHDPETGLWWWQQLTKN